MRLVPSFLVSPLWEPFRFLFSMRKCRSVLGSESRRSDWVTRPVRGREGKGCGCFWRSEARRADHWWVVVCVGFFGLLCSALGEGVFWKGGGWRVSGLAVLFTVWMCCLRFGSGSGRLGRYRTVPRVREVMWPTPAAVAGEAGIWGFPCVGD